MDGTLYGFQGDKSANFSDSNFYIILKQRAINFMSRTQNINNNDAITELEKLSDEFNGEISIGMETKYGISRYEYFNDVWDINPEDYIKKDSLLYDALFAFDDRAILLSSAPRIWIDKVLNYLNLKNIFGERIYSGEPDIRKPDKRAFDNILQDIDCVPRLVISIGDQNKSDILPAKSVGMKTIIIGPEKQDADFKATDIYEAIKILKEVI